MSKNYTPNNPLKITAKHYFDSRLAKIFFFRKPEGQQWAFTLGPWVFYRYGFDKTTTAMINHENIHVCQYAENGIYSSFWRSTWIDEITRFLAKYLFSKEAYRDKPEEVEAYLNEDDPDYIKTRWPWISLTTKFVNK